MYRTGVVVPPGCQMVYVDGDDGVVKVMLGGLLGLHLPHFQWKHSEVFRSGKTKDKEGREVPDIPS